ncbi:DUF445 domain-containing protein [Spongiibacter sp. KMU-158]|uniref:DUF445 domain-containing protein n=1 Tax=Spongiibacter pelagi TaxID=2760804 RepID=A0A927GWL8_9GAMM|nr:DUF445 domain-containing protein [Spongiibacter pelagi]MBD2859595.1 DUF445 domain-containing protein [Spongiibacter pelagi]
MLESIFQDLLQNPHYLLMPLVAGFVGYITKVLALEMMFKPLEFVGIKPPYLGWQGIIPATAGKMAGRATDLLVGRLFTLEELMGRLDPKRMVKELEYPIKEVSEQLVNEVGSRYMFNYWTPLPNIVKHQVVKRIQKKLPGVMEELWDEIRKNPSEYLDVKHMLVSNLVKDKRLLNEIFKNIGAKEFVFFRNAGFWFGFALGFIQLACWLVWHKAWLLPVFGGFVGLFSDWIALQMLFRPLLPTKILGFTIQGKFIARQKEVARDYAELIAKELMTPENILLEVLRGPSSDRLIQLVEEQVEKAGKEQLGVAHPLVKLAMGSKKYDEMRDYLIERVVEWMPEVSDKIGDYAEDALDINNTVVQRMDLLTPEEFEGMLRPAFKENEKVVVLAGAVLGFIIGELQVHMML